MSLSAWCALHPALCTPKDLPQLTLLRSESSCELGLRTLWRLDKAATASSQPLSARDFGALPPESRPKQFRPSRNHAIIQVYISNNDTVIKISYVQMLCICLYMIQLEEENRRGPHRAGEVQSDVLSRVSVSLLFRSGRTKRTTAGASLAAGSPGSKSASSSVYIRLYIEHTTKSQHIRCICTQ